MMRLRTPATLLTGAVLALVPAACGGSGNDGTSAAGAADEPAATATAQSGSGPVKVSGGTTTLRLNPDVVKTLGKVGVAIKPVAPAKAVGNAIRIPISGGTLDLSDPSAVSGRIAHRGGVRFSVAGRSVDATGLVLRPGQGRVTADVAGQRIPFLGVDVQRPREAQSSGTIVLPAGATTVAGDSLQRLQDRVGVDVLPKSLSLGELTVSARP